MITLTPPHKFFGLDISHEEIAIINLIEKCFNSAPPPFEKIDGCRVTSIMVTGLYKSESLVNVAIRYVGMGWTKVVTETSEERGERPGITYFKFYI